VRYVSTRPRSALFAGDVAEATYELVNLLGLFSRKCCLSASLSQLFQLLLALLPSGLALLHFCCQPLVLLLQLLDALRLLPVDIARHPSSRRSASRRCRSSCSAVERGRPLTRLDGNGGLAIVRRRRRRQFGRFVVFDMDRTGRFACCFGRFCSLGCRDGIFSLLFLRLCHGGRFWFVVFLLCGTACLFGVLLLQCFIL
jgi:hypothetical protein